MSKHDPSRRERCDPRRRALLTLRTTRPSAIDHTVPYGTDSLMARFQAFHAWLPSFVPTGQGLAGLSEVSIVRG